MANYKESTLREMCDTCADMLKPAELKATLRFMAGVARDPTWTRVAEELIMLHPNLTVNKAYSQAQKRLAGDQQDKHDEPVARDAWDPDGLHEIVVSHAHASTPEPETAPKEPSTDGTVSFHPLEEDDPLGLIAFVDELPADELRHDNLWDPVVRALRSHPGRWALVHTYATRKQSKSKESAINIGRFRAFRPAGAFQAKAVTTHGEHRLYVRACDGRE